MKKLFFPGTLLIFFLISVIAASAEVTVNPDVYYGTLVVNSDPTGAIVTLNNGVYNGITPVEIQKVPPGTYTLKITKPGYISYINENFIVMQGQPNTVFQALSKNPYYGTIQVSSDPSGADIYVDGTRRGKTGTVPQNEVGGLPDGSHVVKVTLDGYKDYIVTVNTGPDQASYGPVHVVATLVRLSTPTATKQVITSPPATAQVTITVTQPPTSVQVNTPAPTTITTPVVTQSIPPAHVPTTRAGLPAMIVVMGIGLGLFVVSRKE
jgi:hypothetical protein